MTRPTTEIGGLPGAPAVVAHVELRAQVIGAPANDPNGPADPRSPCTFAKPPLNFSEINLQYKNTIHVSHGFALGTWEIFYSHPEVLLFTLKQSSEQGSSVPADSWLKGRLIGSGAS